MPTQKTKFVMSQAQATGIMFPQTPMPSQNSQPMATPSSDSIDSEMPSTMYQPSGGFHSSGRATASVMAWKSGSPTMSAGRVSIGSTS